MVAEDLDMGRASWQPQMDYEEEAQGNTRGWHGASDGRDPYEEDAHSTPEPGGAGGGHAEWGPPGSMAPGLASPERAGQCAERAGGSVLELVLLNSWDNTNQ
eukprot:7322899-Pyramimonas_sp.AAC.1